MTENFDSEMAPESDLRAGLVRRLLVLLFLSAGATMLGALGGIHWAFDLFSHFIAWQGMLSAFLCVALLALRARRGAVCALIVACIQLAQPLSWYWPGPAPEDPANCRILLANVLTTNRDTKPLFDLIDLVDPDIICVQETDSVWAEALRPLEGRYPLHSIVPRSDNFGIALYSRLPGTLDGVLFQSEHHVPAIAATFDVGGTLVALLDIHALPPLGYYMTKRRNGQIDSLRAWLEGQKGPAVVVGDLNLTPYSPIYRRLMRDLDARNARQGFGPQGTWPVWVPFARLPLDQCIVSDEIDVVSCVSGPDIGSDHLPLIIDLHIPAS